MHDLFTVLTWRDDRQSWRVDYSHHLPVNFTGIASLATITIADEFSFRIQPSHCRQIVLARLQILSLEVSIVVLTSLKSEDVAWQAYY